MDVVCDRCRAEYEFDDALVSERGTTVKCTSCGHQFKIYRMSSHPDAVRSWNLRRPDGTVIPFDSLAVLQKWILEGRVSKMDEICRGNEPWKPLGAIAELESFFSTAEIRASNVPAVPPRPTSRPVPTASARPGAREGTPPSPSGRCALGCPCAGRQHAPPRGTSSGEHGAWLPRATTSAVEPRSARSTTAARPPSARRFSRHCEGPHHRRGFSLRRDALNTASGYALGAGSKVAAIGAPPPLAATGAPRASDHAHSPRARARRMTTTSKSSPRRSPRAPRASRGRSRWASSSPAAQASPRGSSATSPRVLAIWGSHAPPARPVVAPPRLDAARRLANAVTRVSRSKTPARSSRARSRLLRLMSLRSRRVPT